MLLIGVAEVATLFYFRRLYNCFLCIHPFPCVCVSNWAVLRVWRALESMLVGHQATKPASQRAATLVGRAPATLPPSQLAQLPSTATSPTCPTLSRLECATTQRGAQRCVPNHQQGVPLRCPGQEDMRLSMCLPTKVGH